MPFLSFMPWCRIDKQYEIGEIAILPFDRGKNIDGLTDDESAAVETLLASYKDLQAGGIGWKSFTGYAETLLMANGNPNKR